MAENKTYEQFAGIKSWAEDDRPREKLLLKGKAALSDAELLAILIGSGTTKLSAVDVAKNILAEVNHNLHELGKRSVNDLKQFRGIGEAKAVTISAAVELGRRRKEVEPVKRNKVTQSRDAYHYLHPHLADLPHEEFIVMLLNRANKIMGHEVVSRGGVSGTVADAKLIFLAAIKKSASGIILAHNHPSGNLKPSRADTVLTDKIRKGAANLDIQLLDHLIIADEKYFSFADEGLM